MFVPQSMISQVPSMIAPKHDDRILLYTQMLYLVEQLLDQCVGIGDTRIITMDEFLLPVGRQMITFNVAVAVELRYVSIPLHLFGFVIRNVRAVGRLLLVGINYELLAFVEVPVFSRRYKWQVRLFESDGKEEWFIRFCQLTHGF